jgi:Cft2 family RNA processing exonuclease
MNMRVNEIINAERWGKKFGAFRVWFSESAEKHDRSLDRIQAAVDELEAKLRFMDQLVDSNCRLHIEREQREDKIEALERKTVKPTWAEEVRNEHT